MADRRRQQTALHKVATPPAPLLLMPASQGLTFSSEDVQLPGTLMPLPMSQPAGQLAVDEAEVDSFVGQTSVSSSFTESSSTSHVSSTKLVSAAATLSEAQFVIPPSVQCLGTSDSHSSMTTQSYFPPQADDPFSSGPPASFPPPLQPPSSLPPIATVTPLHSYPTPSQQPHATPALYDITAREHVPTTPVSAPGVAAPRRASAQIGAASVPLAPVQHHWFYCKNIELRQVWKPFSVADSQRLEAAFAPAQSQGPKASTVVSVEGGRYDVDLARRARCAVYWDETESVVRRCSWFYRSEGDSRLVPYDEDFAARLEECYHNIVTTGDWHRKLEFPEGDVVVIHSPTVILHVTPNAQQPAWANGHEVDAPPPKVAKRGIEEFENIPAAEPTRVDHLVFVVHGIGPGCDLRFRNIVECVDDFRSVSAQMLEDHFKEYQERGVIGRVEFLPVRWHSALHGDATGIDRKLKSITLHSIGKLRQFTNDTLLDVLFYCSPAYAQQIADTIASEMNRLYGLFRSRNHAFSGAVSVAGHSLGSLILFDLLAHQFTPSDTPSNNSSTENIRTADVFIPAKTPAPTKETSEVKPSSSSEEIVTVESLLTKLSLTDYVERFHEEQIDLETLLMCEDGDLKGLGLPLGPRKKLLTHLHDYKHKQSVPAAVVESPTQEVAHVSNSDTDVTNDVTRARRDPLLRSASNTSVDFIVGTAGTGVTVVHYPLLQFRPCHFFALGSPIAMFLTVRGVDTLGEDYRLPTCPGFYNIFHPFDPVAYRVEPMVLPSCPMKPVLIPHHKGRKRLHLELRESLSRVGSDLKQRIIESVRSTWKYLAQYGGRASGDDGTDGSDGSSVGVGPTDSEIDNIVRDATSYYDDTATAATSSSQSAIDEEYPIGKLNRGRRVDYVLQEKPIESFNDYLFALSSHACYWESEDTALLMLKEIYALSGVAPVKSSSDAATAPPPQATFPRHPLATIHQASPGLPLPRPTSVPVPRPPISGSPMPMFPASQPYVSGIPGVGSQPSASPYVTGPPAASGNVGMSPGGISGPPPRTGFVRK